MRGRSLSRIVSQARAHRNCVAGAAGHNASVSDTPIVVFRNLSVSKDRCGAEISVPWLAAFGGILPGQDLSTAECGLQ